MAIELIILLLGISVGSSQTIDYCQKFGREHTMCQYPANSGCRKLAGEVDENAKADILRAHNKYRQMVANGRQAGQPGASNMKEMIWDDELAVVAQRWADQCNFGHDNNRRTGGFPESVGQNVAITGSSVSNSTADFGGAAIKMWYDEVSMFNPSSIEPFVFDMSTGHYTQVVWAETNAVGCGYAYYRKDRWNNKYYVCNYGPAGNMLGGSMYNRGAPCSQCTNGCSSAYPGLCQVAGGDNDVKGTPTDDSNDVNGAPTDDSNNAGPTSKSVVNSGPHVCKEHDQSATESPSPDEEHIQRGRARNGYYNNLPRFDPYRYRYWQY